MPGEFCPRCGAARVASFRFCRQCQFDFDSIAPTPPSPSPFPPLAALPTPAAAPVPPAPATSFAERYRAAELTTTPDTTVAKRERSLPYPITGYLVASGLIGALLLGLLYVGGAIRLGPGSVGTSSEVPPAGQIWFGSSFNPQTFDLSGRTSTVTVGSTFALVAHLTKTVSSGEANYRLTYNGTVMTNQALQISGSGDFYGTTSTPILLAGSYQYDITDLGGNVLATGSFTATSP